MSLRWSVRDDGASESLEAVSEAVGFVAELLAQLPGFGFAVLEVRVSEDLGIEGGETARPRRDGTTLVVPLPVPPWLGLASREDQVVWTVFELYTMLVPYLPFVPRRRFLRALLARYGYPTLVPPWPGC